MIAVYLYCIKGKCDLYSINRFLHVFNMKNNGLLKVY